MNRSQFEHSIPLSVVRVVLSTPVESTTLNTGQRSTVPEHTLTNQPNFHQSTPSTTRPDSQQRRTKAIDAFIDLALETGTAPRPEEVTQRSGVSLATLYRYFATLDDLRQAGIVRVLDRFADLFSIPEIGAGTRQQRIERFCSSRLALHEKLHPLELLARSASVTDSGAAALLNSSRRALADQLRLHFDDELRSCTPARSDDIVATIAALTTVESWHQFRHSLGRTPAQTRRAWIRAVDLLLPRQ